MLALPPASARLSKLRILWCLLRWTDPETSVGYQGETLRKVESRCAASRRCTCPHLCRGNGCNSRTRLRIAQSTAVFTRSGSVWLPRVPIFLRFASWTEVWLWWKGHRHDKWLVRTARQTVLRGRCKLANTSMGKARCAWRGLYWKTVKWIWP